MIAAMPPWNSPIESTIQKCAPALAAGNTVVLRVPEEAPSGGLILAQLAVEAGFPAGVLNALAGMGPESGEALVGHQKVRLVSFTGSAPTGKIIARTCAEQMKPVVMELGGKSPVIIFDDARIADAIESSVSSAFCFQGQICCATTRVLVHESILDEVVKGIVERVERYDVDNEEFPIGPLFNDKVFHTVEKFVAQGKKDGTLVAGGGGLSVTAVDAITSRLFFSSKTTALWFVKKRFLVPSWRSFHFLAMKKRSRSPTTSTMAWPQPYTPRTVNASSKPFAN